MLVACPVFDQILIRSELDFFSIFFFLGPNEIILKKVILLIYYSL